MAIPVPPPEPIKAWTSGVNTNTTTASNPSNISYSNITPSYPGYGGVTVGGYPGASGSQVPPPNVFVQTPARPTEGMIAMINGKVYRYSEALNEWHEVIDAPDVDVTAAPVISIELDARSMLDALRQYESFLDELDGLDQRYSDVVNDTLFGLHEAIEALERLEQK